MTNVIANAVFLSSSYPLLTRSILSIWIPKFCASSLTVTFPFCTPANAAWWHWLMVSPIWTSTPARLCSVNLVVWLTIALLSVHRLAYCTYVLCFNFTKYYTKDKTAAGWRSAIHLWLSQKNLHGLPLKGRFSKVQKKASPMMIMIMTIAAALGTPSIQHSKW